MADALHAPDWTYKGTDSKGYEDYTCSCGKTVKVKPPKVPPVNWHYPR